MIEAKFKRVINGGTKELLNLLIHDNEWWQVSDPDENGICEAWVYGSPKQTMTLKEVHMPVGEPIDGEYEQHQLIGYQQTD